MLFMSMMNIVSNLKNKIIKIISNLTSIQKLMYSIIFLLIMIFITKFLFGYIFSDNLLNIDYKSISGDSLYSLSSIIYDDNTYAQVKTIADNFINSISLLSSQYDNSSIDTIYNYCLYSEYKKTISKKEFIEKSSDFYNNVSKIYYNNGDIIPDAITQYRNNFYLIKYVVDDGDNSIESYLGIALDVDNQKYYIWYLE